MGAPDNDAGGTGMETDTSRQGVERDVSHEFKESLAAITALLRAATLNGGVPPEARHCLEQVDAKVRDLSIICDELVGVLWTKAVVGATSGRLSHAGHSVSGLLGEVIAIDKVESEAPERRTGLVAEGVPGTPTWALTGQERRILALIARGCTNRQIGEQLFLAEKTVKNYVSNLLRKLAVESRTQAAIYATRLYGISTPAAPSTHPSPDRRMGLTVVPPPP